MGCCWWSKCLWEGCFKLQDQQHWKPTRQTSMTFVGRPDKQGIVISWPQMHNTFIQFFNINNYANTFCSNKYTDPCTVKGTHSAPGIPSTLSPFDNMEVVTKEAVGRFAMGVIARGWFESADWELEWLVWECCKMKSGMEVETENSR